jgi:hypothetical protein
MVEAQEQKGLARSVALAVVPSAVAVHSVVGMVDQVP